MSNNKEKTGSDCMEWSAEDEIQLFYSLDGLRPVGINRHFFMACISERLSKALNRDIATDLIWTHLYSMYNLKALDDTVPLPFPNDEKDFSLPETEFSALLTKKKIEVEDQKKTEIKSEQSGTKSGRIFFFLGICLSRYLLIYLNFFL